MSLHSSVCTQSSEKACGSEAKISDSEPNSTSNKSTNLDGFQMLLQAAQMAEGKDYSCVWLYFETAELKEKS